MGIENLKFIYGNFLTPPYVFFERDEKLKIFCEENKIKYKEFEHGEKIISSKELFSKFDFGICSGFMKIIPSEIINSVKIGIFNLHCGKLPEFRGRAPISRTLIAGHNELTVTLHKMDAGIDSGDILDVETIKIESTDDVNVLYKKATKAASVLIYKNLHNINSGVFELKKQDLSLKPEANGKLTRDECKINWNDSVNKITDKIRALTFPYPGAFFEYDGKDFIIDFAMPALKLNHVKKIDLQKSELPMDNTAIVNYVSDETMHILCKDGVIIVLKLRNVAGFSQFKKGDILL